MIIITPNRIKSIVSDCKTDADLVATLRHHKIRYRYTTESGFLSVVVPCSSGKVRVYRTASKSNPFAVIPVQPAHFYYKPVDT
jgi:hypothetical protein